jgi:hypothetical protein
MKQKKARNKTTLIDIQCIREAPDDKRFVLQDGRVLKDIKELADALEHMSEDVYSHHVGNGKNDFSTWVKDVLSEQELAEDLAAVDNQLNSQITVLKHIAKNVY